MSLGKPGHRPVVRRLMASTRDSSTLKPSDSSSTFSFIRCSTAVIGSMSTARTPRTSTVPPVMAATTAQLPASM